jgi:Na+/melibiose symporter-like transporter
MASLCIVTLFLLLTRFKARYRTEPTVTRWKSQRRMDQDELANRATRLGLSVYNAALLGLMLLNIITVGSIASFETTGIRFAASYFDLQPVLAGTIVSLSGIVGVCSLLSIGFLGRFLTDTQMIVGGFTVLAIGTVSFASLQSVEMGAENSIVHYIVAIFVIYGFGYPIAQSAVIGLFSKGKFTFSLKLYSLHIELTS